MAKLAKWQKEYIEQIESMSNAELLDEVLELAYIQDEGDNRDRWQYSAVQLHLRMRLINWLNEDKGEK